MFKQNEGSKHHRCTDNFQFRWFNIIGTSFTLTKSIKLNLSHLYSALHGSFLQLTLNADAFAWNSQPAAMQWWCQGTWECQQCQQCHASPKLLGAHLLSLYRLIYNCRAASPTFVFSSLWKWSLLCWKSFHRKTFLDVFATQSYTEPFHPISNLTIDGI